MDTHNRRKEAARDAILKAHADGVEYEEMGAAIGIKPGLLRGFAATGKLGPEKTRALLKWLEARGYLVHQVQIPMVLEKKTARDLLADRLVNLSEILRSTHVAGNVKAEEFYSFVMTAHSSLDALIASIKSGDTKVK